jgi:hypothetical protein
VTPFARRERSVDPSPPEGGARSRALAGALLALALAGCGPTVLVRATGPVPAPAAGGGASYAVGKLICEVPAAWEVRGDAGHLTATHPQSHGRLDVQVTDRSFRDEAECLAQAGEALQRGAAEPQGLRQHPTTFAGRPGVAAEGDQGAWHGWAWAFCDGTTQYRVSFFGATPLRADVLAAWSSFTRGARIQP